MSGGYFDYKEWHIDQIADDVEAYKHTGNNVTISFPPPITCYYLIGGERLKLGLTKKPSWFHRFMMKFAFGIEFEEIKK